ncbi:MAG TPA: hypothetical protein VFV52_10235, partial [Bacilli bacterium]|nr:hypothetical protein [Bacilli bacterium]
LDVATEKPDDLTVDRYRRSIADLKADILLSLNPNTAADKVAELARSTSHPYLAEMLRDDLASVLAPITGNMKPEQRQAIAREVESLRTRFYTPEQVEAQKALVFVESSKSWSLFDGIVQENIRNQFGPNVAGILNNPEAIEARLNPPTDSENEASA